MSNKSTLLAVLGLLITAAVLGAYSQTGEDLFQKALRLERNEGKMMEAIELYKTILKQFPGNRELAAEAQFHIGLCYEQLGNQEAQNAYQTVIQDYGEQKEVVAKAKGRLSKLKRPDEKLEEPEGIRIRQVWKKPLTDFLGSVSPDGRFLACVHWGEGDLAIHDLISGEDKILTHEADLGLAKGFAMTPLFSKNGRQIAYSWWHPNHTYDLLLVDVDNPSPRKLYRREGEHVYPAAWLSDEELIIARHNYATQVALCCSLRISDGTIRELKTFELTKWPRLSCSPDEKYIAYDFADETDGGKFDINLMTMEGASEISLVKHPANDRVLGWVPGRKEFLFISDRSGTWDLWAIPVDGGKPSGPEKRIYTDIGEVDPVGFAQNGDCFIGFNKRNFNAYLAPFNAETGQLDEKSGKTLLGSKIWIEWSPDGQYLSYIEEESGADNPHRLLIIQDLKTAEERKLAENLNAASACWSPDGNSISVVGYEKSNRTKSAGIYTVDVKTDQTTQIVNLLDYKGKINPPGDDAFPLSDVQWSSDGKSIFFLFFTDRLVKRDLATGEDTVLYKNSRFERSVMKLSPDGKNLLFGVQNLEEKKSRLYTIPVEGGPEKELCPPREAFGLGTAIWSPDGKYVYFTERKDGTSLWRIPAEGGVPQKVWHSKNRADVFGIHPDGKQIALAVREMAMEIRVIENLVQELEKIYKISE
ncbi:MAG TPA: tetratricopeptide repeat protein [Candidatus Desulfaltia sp.]|nr:tetratricopeptide repeat protein [Candidatus Desulfaltia sp.]